MNRTISKYGADLDRRLWHERIEQIALCLDETEGTPDECSAIFDGCVFGLPYP